MKKDSHKHTEIGGIPYGWQVNPLITVADVVMGQSPPSSTYNIDKTGMPFFQGRTDFGSRYPLVTVWCSEPKKISKKGDVLLSVRAPVGDLNIAKEDCCIGRGLAAISLKKGSNNFLYYLLSFNKEKLKSIFESEGTVFGCVNKKGLNDFDVYIPKNLEERESIAKVLSDLDSKIELNSEMNKTLEAVGRALFNRWFVDYEFPDEKGRPYKSSGGEMVYCEELGKEIPIGWTGRKLKEFIDLERGLSYKGSGLSEEGIPMVNLGMIAPHCGFLYAGLKYYIGEFKERNLVRPGDLVIANTDITQNRVVLGSPAIVPSDLGSEKILFTHHIYAVRNKSILPNLFLYYLLQLENFKERSRGFATGTTVLALPEDAVLELQFVVPEEGLLTKFNELATSIQEKTTVNHIENRTLIKIRDSLLPKLMSGEIRVA